MKPIYIFLILLVAIIQTTIIPYFSIKFGAINLILVIFVTLIFCRYFKLGLVWAIGGGIILDLLASTPPGYYTLNFLLVYILLRIFLKMFDFEEPVAFVLIIFVSSLIFDFASYGYFLLWGSDLSIKSYYSIIFFDGLLNLTASLIIYPSLIYIKKRFLSRGHKIISLVELYK